MRFILPGATTRGLTARVAVGGPRVGAAIGKPSRASSMGGTGGVPGLGFALATPGDLGEYVGWDEGEDEEVIHPAMGDEFTGLVGPDGVPLERTGKGAIDELAKWPLETIRTGVQRGAMLGARLVHDYQGAPGGFFRGLNYRVAPMARYVGASNWLRAKSPELGLRWTEWGWADSAREERFWRGVEEIQRQTREGRGLQEALSRAGREMRFEREEMEHILRAGIIAGKLPRWDSEVGNERLAWEDFESVFLSMRMFTEEQVGMLSPWTATPTIRDSLETFHAQGLVAPFPNRELAAPVWRVTDRAVKRGLETGILSEAEAGYRTSVRRGQLLHDLAVGDGILLVGMQLASEGVQVVNLETETALLAVQKTGVFPDFVMHGKRAGVEREIPVEVVGVGANYRARAKQSKVASAGFRVFSPGFDGHGVRLG